ncbi:MAG: FtsL-like putative cell division protein [Bacteroidales bacterium]|nr:FtsL-like putative cell division protein [Bacteroidales bacterium]
MDERVEFIDHKVEQKEIRKGFLKELLDGSVLTTNLVTKQLPFLVFITFLAIVYIGNRYNAEKVVRQTVFLQKRIKELKAESVSISAILMDISKQSEVSKLVGERGLDLIESVEPPKRLIITEED